MPNEQSVELDQVYAILSIPRDCVEIKMNCTIYKDGKLCEVHGIFTMQEIQLAIQEASDYIPPDAVFTLTDKGREYLKELERRHAD